MSNPLYAVIMAGGSGTRLWPLSRQAHPKQVQDLANTGRSMFQSAVDRLLPIMPADQILIVTTKRLVAQLIAQVPDIPVANYIVEPEGRGTAPVIGVGALVAEHYAGGPATVACLTADHFIADVARFQQTLLAAARIAEQGEIVTLGIQPTGPETGFGYIEQAEQVGTDGDLQIYRARKFKEKPTSDLAERYFADGKHTWNSGMFIWTTTRVREEFSRQLPETMRLLGELEPHMGKTSFATALERVWPTMPVQTIDYGIMEGAERIAVIPVEMGWNDVGNWAALLGVLAGDEHGNIRINAEHIAVDTRNTLVFSKRLVATIGLDGYVVVDTPDALLICPADRAQDVKQVINQLKDNPDLRGFL